MNPSETNDISPLILAINSNSLANAAAAVSAGCDVNGTFNGMSPVICAIQNGRPELVRLLLERGANPLQSDQNTPWTPFMLASIQIHLPPRRHRPARVAKASREIVKIFEEFGARDTDADRIYGCGENAVLKAAKLRSATAKTQVFEAEDVVIEYPERLRNDLLGRAIPTISLLELARAHQWEKLAGYLAL